MSVKRIAIIGAGASGLASIKACKEVGLEPVCFEKTQDLGGLWRYRTEVEDGIASAMKCTIINSSKEMMCYSDFPVPDDYPNFMHNSQVWQYLRLYAEHYDLLQHIQFCVSVTSMRQEREEDGDRPTGRWCLQLYNTQTQRTWTDTFHGVMLCTGHHGKRNMPDYPGMSGFQGIMIHTQEYRDSRRFDDKRVVVVGAGNSALDMAVDLSHSAKQVWVSTRRGAWVMSRVADSGVPVDLLVARRFTNTIVGLLPASWLDGMIEKAVNKRFDHDLYGLRPEHRLSAAHPTVSDDLPNRIASGRIIMKPDIKRIMPTGLRFVDGTLLDEIDAIIFGTGYQITFPYLEEGVINVENNEIDLYKLIFPPCLEHATLAVIGCVQPLGATIPIAEMQARWAAMVLQGDRKLPDEAEMLREIQTRREKIRQRYVKSQRHTIQVDYIDYMDDIATCIGCMPHIGWMFLTEPRLAARCLFGPVVSSQWRLRGPGAWDGARRSIWTLRQRVEQPFKTRQVPKTALKKKSRKCSLLLMAIAGLVIAIWWMAY